MNLPNRLTVFRIVLIPVLVILMEIGPGDTTFSLFGSTLSALDLAAALVFIVGSITDWLDGYIARRDHLITDFGKFADPLADKMLVISALIALAARETIPAWAVTVIVMRELAVTGLRLVLAGKGTVMAAGKSGKIKTVTQMFAIIFLLLDDFPFGGVNLPLGQILFYVAVVLTVYSMIDYFYHNRQVFQTL